MENDEEERFEIERIIRRRAKSGKIQYFIKWKDYSTEHNSWTDEENMDCQPLLDEFLAHSIIGKY